VIRDVLARVSLLLIPIMLVGLFGRVLYTPDEPREGSMVVAMAHQADKSLPTLAGAPFAEKPPLLYWMGAATVTVLGATPSAMRLPALIYWLGAALAIAVLVARTSGPQAGFAAGLVAATSLQLYQVGMWLATDGPLVAGVAVSLLGCFTALSAQQRARRQLGYGVFHLGLAIAFFAKGFAGWMVPGFAYLTVVLWERRFRELWSVELWVGALVLIALIGTWVAWVAHGVGGLESLKVMFWYNLVGRAVAVNAPGALQYANGHLNSPAKYLLELPVYLLPWTALAVAACRKLPRALQRTDPEGTAWRLSIGAVLPATLLLSFAATARGVYYGPPALGFAMMIGLYVGSAGAALDRWDRWAWRLTGWLIASIAVALGLLAVLVNFAPLDRSAGSMALGVLAAVTLIAVVRLSVRTGKITAACLPTYALAFALTLTGIVGPVYFKFNQWLSLEQLAHQIDASRQDQPLQLIDPDETTLAMASLYLPAALADDARKDVAPWLLWRVPKRGHWGLSRWLQYMGYRSLPTAVDDELVSPVAGMRVLCLFERPGGRALALLGPVQLPLKNAPRCDGARLGVD